MSRKSLAHFPERLFYKIGDVAEILEVKPYVIRYWESEFSFLTPDKSVAGQRVYRRQDVENLLVIKKLLYVDRYSIEGARKRFLELRKNGEMKEIREELTEEVIERVSSFSEEAATEISRIAQEISSLVKKPSKTVFKF